MNDLKKLKTIYFIGIGGIMMSAVARFFVDIKKNVLGSDREESELTIDLVKRGAIVNYEQKKENIHDGIDLIVCTAAINSDNPELKQAKKLKIPVCYVYQIIGFLSREKFCVAVSGMHGKSTTTALTSLVIRNAKLDPTVFVGTKVKEFGGNFRFGRSKYMVTEACEYKDNFLSLSPDILVINNIEPEHLDYFKNLNNIKKSFLKLIFQIKPNGYLVVNSDDKNILSILPKIKVIKLYLKYG